MQPGAVWEVPEKARAYLLDLLHGGGVGLHVDYANLVLRTLHDLAEVPRSAFGENRQALSGVALQMELDPLLKKVQRKRLTRSAAFRRRSSIGSSPRSAAIRSSWLSKAKRGWGVPLPRMAPQAGGFG